MVGVTIEYPQAEQTASQDQDFFTVTTSLVGLENTEDAEMMEDQSRGKKRRAEDEQKDTMNKKNPKTKLETMQ